MGFKADPVIGSPNNYVLDVALNFGGWLQLSHRLFI